MDILSNPMLSKNNISIFLLVSIMLQMSVHYDLPLPNLKFLVESDLLRSKSIFCFFSPTNVSNSSNSPTSGIVSG